MKIAIIYHSVSGNTRSVAEDIMKGMEKQDSIEIKAMSIDEIDDDFVRDAKAVVFGCPIYAGTLSWQMKKFFDTTNLPLAGKLGCVFATANFLGGGGSVGELTMITAMLVRGMLVYSAGAAEGQPYTHLGVVAIRSGDDWQKERARIFGERIARKATELWGDASEKS